MFVVFKGDKFIFFNSMQFSNVFSIFVNLGELTPSKLISDKCIQPLKVDFMLTTSFILKLFKLTLIISLLSLKRPSKLLRLFLNVIKVDKIPEYFGVYLLPTAIVFFKNLKLFLSSDIISISSIE